MENPFIIITTTTKEDGGDVIVTGTADNEDTYWYILAGSYNGSFAQNPLVTEKESLMVEDDGKDVATQNYYYFYWGLPQYEQNTMVAHIFARVDINGDDKLDSSFNEKADLESIKKVDTVDVDDVATGPVFDDTNTGCYKIEGGKILKATLNTPAQRQALLTESADDPYDDARAEYVAGTITINKSDPAGAPLADAEFNVMDGDGITIATITSNEAGVASYTGLLIAVVYSIVEVTAPAGYTIDSFPASFIIDLENSKEVLVVMNSLIPPVLPPTEDPEGFGAEGVTELIQAAGATRTPDKIEVLGVAELPYTGMNPMVLLAGIALLVGLSIAGLALRKKDTSK